MKLRFFVWDKKDIKDYEANHTLITEKEMDIVPPIGSLVLLGDLISYEVVDVCYFLEEEPLIDVMCIERDSE
jgi:hypothetical protein